MKQKPKKIEEPVIGFLEDEALRAKKEKHKYLIITLLNTILLYGVYAVLTQFSFWNIVVIVYMAALGAVSFGYVFYNRGFTRKNVTVEMLPEHWSEEEKEEFIADGKRRLRKSKWCITLLFPLVFTFFMDLFYLFIYEPYFAATFENLFS